MLNIVKQYDAMRLWYSMPQEDSACNVQLLKKGRKEDIVEYIRRVQKERA